jgi:3-methyladenine DNA glycosylase AlkC
MPQKTNPKKDLITMNSSMDLSSRTGARCLRDIPPIILDQLNQGVISTKNLVEWLAIDMNILYQSLSLHSPSTANHFTHYWQEWKVSGITKRMRAMGKWLATHQHIHPETTIYQQLRTHPADMVRGWLSYSVMYHDIPLAKRLELARPFATDAHMAVRECAWDSLRDPFLIKDIGHAISLLETWVNDPNPFLRRCAIEATRPRGVWTCHIQTLKENPEQALPLLEKLRNDTNRYVQTAVANWLNDASKTCPDWTIALWQRWQKESPTKATAWIIHHASRTLRKKDWHMEPCHKA